MGERSRGGYYHDEKEKLPVNPGVLTNVERDFLFYFLRAKEKPEFVEKVEEIRQKIGNDRAHELESQLANVIEGRSESLGNVIETEMDILPPHSAPFPKGTSEVVDDRSFSQESVPRTRYLGELLSSLGYKFTTVNSNFEPTKNRKRFFSNYSLLIPEKGNVILAVCDESREATYIIFDVQKPEEEWPTYAQMTKAELTSIPNRVLKIRWKGDRDSWAKEITDRLVKYAKPNEKFSETTTWKPIRDIAANLKTRLSPYFDHTSDHDLAKYFRSIFMRNFMPTLKEGVDYDFKVLPGSPGNVLVISPKAEALIEERVLAKKENMDRYPEPPEGAITFEKFAQEIQEKHAKRLVKSGVRAALYSELDNLKIKPGHPLYPLCRNMNEKDGYGGFLTLELQEKLKPKVLEYIEGYDKTPVPQEGEDNPYRIAQHCYAEIKKKNPDIQFLAVNKSVLTEMKRLRKIYSPDNFDRERIAANGRRFKGYFSKEIRDELLKRMSTRYGVEF